MTRSVAKLRELTTRVTKGTTPTTIGGSFQNSGIHFVKVESITGDGRIDRTKLAYIDTSTHTLLKRSILEADDLLFTIAGTIGRVARVTEDLLPANTNQAVAIVRADRSKVDVGYLFYALRAKEGIDFAQSRLVQSVQANLSLGDLSELELALPPLEEQRGIAEVLGALDDKIAANAKLANASVSLADTIFTGEICGNDIGTATFADLASIQGGGTPSTKVKDYWGGQINWATPTDITKLQSPYLESTSRRITDAGLAACSSALHPVGSILMTSRATIGAFAIAQEPTAVNQGFIVVNAHDNEAQWWLFHEMRSRVPEFLTHANGATFLELSRGKFKQFRVRLPDQTTVRRFSETAGPLHARARSSAIESKRLADMRDWFLPRLMSGQIRVSDADRVVEGAL